MKHHSIFVRLNLLFGFALVMLLLLFALFHFNASQFELRQAVHRGMEIERMLHHSRTLADEQRRAMVSDAGFSPIEQTAIPKNARRIPPPPNVPKRRQRFEMLHDGEHYYYEIPGPDGPQRFEDTQNGADATVANLVFALLLIGLFSLYWTLRGSLIPIRTLSEQIRRFAEGDHDVDTSSERKDEIALISNEFNDAVRKIRSMQASRTLFLRNIMHELKTPLTKGKLAVALMQPDNQTRYLDRLFDRMDELIAQLARIETAQSSELKREYRTIASLLEDARARLCVEEGDDTVVVALQDDASVHVDAELFTSALANLIDNAVKYADTLPVHVRFDEEHLCVANAGAALSKPIEHYWQPFVGENEKSGLGLGLYIAKSVIEAHGFRLEYAYAEGVHRFCVRFA